MAAIPAAKDLFEINETDSFLSRADAEAFHSRVVAKLLYYVYIRARMDLLLATCFLATRSQKAHNETFEVEKTPRMHQRNPGKTVHRWSRRPKKGANVGRRRVRRPPRYAQSHCGGGSSRSDGVALHASQISRNEKSSTEAEVVGASDYLPNTIWD